MISRRKMFAWLSAIPGAGVITWIGTPRRAQAAADVGAMEGFPGFLYRKKSDEFDGVAFKKWQNYFRKNPELLWRSSQRSKTEVARMMAVEAAETWREWYPDIEFDAFVDSMTDNLVLKVYHCAKTEGQRTEFALCIAITRHGINEPQTDHEFNSTLHTCWAELVEAIQKGKADPDGFARKYGEQPSWRRRDANVSQTSGVSPILGRGMAPSSS